MIASYYESNLTARQPHRAPHHVIHVQASEWKTCPRSLYGG